jgi:uncharacterized membrane protein HdeD (DUF308 family)
MTEAVAVEKDTQVIPWWVVLLEGIAAIIIGILLVTNTAGATLILVQVLGIWWFIKGIFQIIAIFIDSEMWGWKLFAGIIGILAGILIIQHPLWSTRVVLGVTVIILGIQGLIVGIINLIQAFKGGGWGIGILGALSIVFGIILLANVYIAAAILPWVLGIFAIVGGIFALIMAFRLK